MQVNIMNIDAKYSNITTTAQIGTDVSCDGVNVFLIQQVASDR